MLPSIPIRLRLTFAFAGVMAALLAGAGLFLHASLADGLDATIDRGLRARAADASALAGDERRGLANAPVGLLSEAGESFGQILTRDGRVLDATSALGDAPLIDQALRDRAATDPVVVGRTRVPGIDDPVRILATPIPREPGQIVVVGTSLEDRDDAVDNLGRLLLIGGPVALLLASVTGYLLAAAALRPVEAMRARSASISGGGRGERLPVPPARDEVRRLGETLNDMLGRVDDAMERERAFVADASHELRTPLAILKTELELAMRGERSVGELRTAIASAGEETDRLSRLAEDLLIIARSDQDGLPVRTEPFAGAAALETVRDRFTDRAGRDARTIVVVPGDAATVVADRLRIEQALGNLVENAVRHGAGTIRLSAGPAGDGVEFRVTDEGAGFPAAFVPRAFERFSRADPARGRGGAGLGLAIVRAIADAHGGRAYVGEAGHAGGDVRLVIPASSGVPPVPLI